MNKKEKKRLQPCKTIRKENSNLNRTKSQKDGIEPDNIEKKVLNLKNLELTLTLSDWRKYQKCWKTNSLCKKKKKLILEKKLNLEKK